MDRIPLADKDIQETKQGILIEFATHWPEQLKKQILDDYEFRKKWDSEKTQIINIRLLEELKEEILSKDYEYKRVIDLWTQDQKNKEIVQKVREYKEQLGQNIDQSYDEPYLKLKEILGDNK